MEEWAMAQSRIDRRSLLAGMASGVMALSMGTSVAAKMAGDQTAAIETDGAITISVMDGMFIMPNRVAAGMVTMTLVNTGRSDHSAQLLRHREGVLLPDITNAIRQGGMAEMTPLVMFAGGPGHVAPGGTQTVMQELVAGTYTVICTAVSDEGLPHAVASLPHRLEVSEHDAAIEEPGATGEIQLIDYSFEGLPAEIPVGRQVWKVSSDGSEPHELGIRRLNDGVTAEMVISTLLEGGKGYPESDSGAGALQMLAGLPMSPAGGIQALDPGTSGWVVVDLEPGNYLAVSLMPSSANGGALQAMLGMIQGFTVLA